MRDFHGVYIPVPVMLYNYPLNTGINLEPDTVARVAEHPNVCGIKDSSGNIPQAAHVIHLTPKSFHVRTTRATLTDIKREGMEEWL